MHDHDHPHPHPSYSDRPHPQHVVLEIGDDVGALIVYTDPELLGSEVEISPASDDGRRSHKDVLERTTGGRSEHVLVFDGLLEGAYTLWLAGRARQRDVRVVGGAISELDWRRRPASARSPASAPA